MRGIGGSHARSDEAAIRDPFIQAGKACRPRLAGGVRGDDRRQRISGSKKPRAHHVGSAGKPVAWLRLGYAFEG